MLVGNPTVTADLQRKAPELPPMSKELEEITDSQEVAHMKTEEAAALGGFRGEK